MAGKIMEPISAVTPEHNGGRPIMRSANGGSRIALPMAYIETCVSKVEEDFLWRFFEASEFSEGRVHVMDEDGTPSGRYAEHADTMAPQHYVRLEVEAYRWVRKFGLGKEWSTIAEIFLRMQTGGARLSFEDWGAFLTNSDNEYVALGGGQVSFRCLGIRLKDAYRDFFRWYRYVNECETRGIEPTGSGAYAAQERERRVAMDIERFKRARGLSVENDALSNADAAV